MHEHGEGGGGSEGRRDDLLRPWVGEPFVVPVPVLVTASDIHRRIPRGENGWKMPVKGSKRCAPRTDVVK